MWKAHYRAKYYTVLTSELTPAKLTLFSGNQQKLEAYNFKSRVDSTQDKIYIL